MPISAATPLFDPTFNNSILFERRQWIPREHTP
jgi:hypothetical protein